MSGAMDHQLHHASGAVAASPPHAARHTMLEDVYGMAVGMMFIVTGVVLLSAAGLVTGGIAGIALLVSYVAPLSVGTIFTLVNVPFFVFAYFVMGPRFAIKSTLASCGITLLLAVTRQALHIDFESPLFAAVVGGTLNGMGVLALARHGSGVGGTGVLTLWLQRTRGINAGIVQVAIDSMILLTSILVIPTGRVGWSALSAVAMSAMVIAWHRPGRYNVVVR